MSGADPRPLVKLACAWFLLQVQLWLPVWVLFLRDERGFSLTEVVFVDIVFSGVVLVCEVPLGLLADRIGHRRALISAAVLLAMTQLALAFVSGLPSLLAVWTMWGLAVTMLSGTETAYRYEAVRAYGGEARGLGLFALLNAVGSLGLLVSHGVAGVLYELSPTAPFLVNAVCASAAALLLVGLADVPAESKQSLDLAHGITARSVLRGADPRLRALVVLLAAIVAYHWTTTLVIQPLLSNLGMPPRWIGATYAAAGLLGVAGAFASSRVFAWLGLRGLVIGAVLLQTLSVLLSGTPLVWLAVAGICLHAAALQVADPVLRVLISRRVSVRRRAAVLSLASLGSTFILLGSRPLVGLVAEHASPSTSMLVWAALGALLVPVAAWATRVVGGDERVERGDEIVAAESGAFWR